MNEVAILQRLEADRMVSQRIKFPCGQCQQILAADASAAGKKVRCPKCQQLAVIPSATGGSSATHPVLTEQPSGLRKVTVVCASCGTKLAIKATAKPSVATCPNCKSSVQVPAAKSPVREATSGKNPEASAAASPASFIENPVGLPTDLVAGAVSDPSGALDLGQLDVGLPSSPAVTAPRPVSAGTRAASMSRAIFAWINSHRWITLILVLNVFPFLIAIRFPPALVMSLFNVPIGLVLIGLLFIPRQHIVKRVMDKFGAQLATIGIGGFATVVGVVLLKALPRLANRMSNNSNLDFSNVGALIGVLIGHLVVLSIVVVLWRYVGIARTLAAGYCAQLSVMTLMLAIGAASLDNTLNPGNASAVAASDTPYQPPSGLERIEQRRQEQARAQRERGAASRPGGPNTLSKWTSRESHDTEGVVMNQTPEDRGMAMRIKSFRERNSMEQTIVIKITPSDPTDTPPEIRTKLQEALGLKRHFFAPFGERALLLFVHEGPVSEVVAELQMGEVLSVDDDERTIEFRINSLTP
ncbi:MAG: hypothetical protein AAFX06_03615 [Planctomycetota bacterium]